MPPAYQPIASSFHAVLEAAAARRQPVYLQWFNDLRQLCQGTVVLKAFAAHAGAEYAVLDSGEQVRLDNVIRLDDTAAPAYADYPDFRCGC